MNEKSISLLGASLGPGFFCHEQSLSSEQTSPKALRVEYQQPVKSPPASDGRLDLLERGAD
ncbi:hypothetical protein N7497_010493 [Penicillium chrysogenum]|jgi:hypothetical protein|nr:hypothetical protein N7497_010493 [Penicillium chrysogenum]